MSENLWVHQKSTSEGPKLSEPFDIQSKISVDSEDTSHESNYANLVSKTRSDTKIATMKKRSLSSSSETHSSSHFSTNESETNNNSYSYEASDRSRDHNYWTETSNSENIASMSTSSSGSSESTKKQRTKKTSSSSLSFSSTTSLTPSDTSTYSSTSSDTSTNSSTPSDSSASISTSNSNSNSDSDSTSTSSSSSSEPNKKKVKQKKPYQKKKKKTKKNLNIMLLLGLNNGKESLQLLDKTLDLIGELSKRTNFPNLVFKVGFISYYLPEKKDIFRYDPEPPSSDFEFIKQKVRYVKDKMQKDEGHYQKLPINFFNALEWIMQETKENSNNMIIHLLPHNPITQTKDLELESLLEDYSYQKQRLNNTILKLIDKSVKIYYLTKKTETCLNDPWEMIKKYSGKLWINQKTEYFQGTESNIFKPIIKFLTNFNKPEIHIETNNINESYRLKILKYRKKRYWFRAIKAELWIMDQRIKVRKLILNDLIETNYKPKIQHFKFLRDDPIIHKDRSEHKMKAINSNQTFTATFFHDKSINGAQTKCLNNCKNQLLASKLANQFNAKKTYCSIQFTEKILCELDKKFPKNFRYCYLMRDTKKKIIEFDDTFITEESTTSYSTLSAFSHYVYQETHGKILLSSFKGFLDKETFILTDLVVYKKGSQKYLDFKREHHCSNTCKQLKLKILKNKNFNNPFFGGTATWFDYRILCSTRFCNHRITIDRHIFKVQTKYYCKQCNKLKTYEGRKRKTRVKAKLKRKVIRKMKLKKKLKREKYILKKQKKRGRTKRHKKPKQQKKPKKLKKLKKHKQRPRDPKKVKRHKEKKRKHSKRK
ncbi:n-acetyltransferase eco [Anaeramoeba flamelloides]|uniref:N-acetyltransferase eco n=1 Tax=Anaeramoeba flamelloides TaxID=1746091 RepID=A0AAV8AHN3_9EUKA|nr:n-acetyltransferase eco [Anaeramoeba flamelloides]